MNIFKRIFCVILCVALLINFAACSDNTENTSSTVNGNNGNNTDSSGTSENTSSVVEGEPEIPADEEFELPKGEFGVKGAPILIGATRKVEVGDTVLVVGEGLSAKGIKAYIYAKGTDGKCKTYECKYQTVKDNEIAIVTDKNMKYGIYAVYVTTDKGNSNLLLVNDPKIHWIGTTAVTKEDTLSIYGENLTHENTDNTKVYFTADGKYVTPEIIQKNPYKITVKIPANLTVGKEYEVSLYSGVGGDHGVVKAEEKIKFVDKKVNDFSAGKTINVTDYGANPANNGANDIAGIKAAIAAAKDGDTIYFPNGTYLVDGTISTRVSLRFKGESQKGAIILAGPSSPEKMFDISSKYCEFTTLALHDVKQSGKLKTKLIYYKGSKQPLDYCAINVHDCYIYQENANKEQTTTPALAFIETSNSRFENNESLATVVLWTNDITKMYFRNNKVYGNMWMGHDNQNSTCFWKTDMCDVSGNTIMAKDALTDNTHILEGEDRIAGRSLVFQGFLKNGYISENKIVAGGSPDTNGGEQILLETGSLLDYDKPLKVTENSFTVPDDYILQTAPNWNMQIKPGDVVAVVYGKGVGQYRIIKEIVGKTIYVDKPWDIMPNKDSLIGVALGGQNIFVYKNDICGYKNYAENPGATTSVSTSGPTFNFNIIDNKFTDLVAGLFMSHKYKASHNGLNPITIIHYHNIVSGNEISNTCKAIRYELYYTIPQPNMEGEDIYLSMGAVFRRNSISNVKDYKADLWTTLGGQGLNIGTPRVPYNHYNKEGPTWVGDWIYGVVFENNTFKNCEINVSLLKHQGNNIFRNNSADKGELYKEYSPYCGSLIVFDD